MFSLLKCRRNNNLVGRVIKNQYCKKIGLFGDIHFQDKGLDRIVQTSDWIIKEFSKQKVAAVVCLGDTLNTRELVSVNAQSSAFYFFDRMSRELKVPIHILAGNHDLHLKRSQDVTSLDSLDMDVHRQNNIFFHKKITHVDVEGQQAIMFPYYENHETILEYIKELETTYGENMKNMVGFAHIGINNSLQNSRSSWRYKGPVASSCFAGFKRTFSGHFHVHQELNHNFMYVGSPLQFNFGDCGDDRGVIIYDTKTNETEWIINPHCYAFLKFNYPDDMKKIEANPDSIKDTFVQMNYKDFVIPQQKEEIKEKLKNFGALSVVNTSALTSAIQSSQSRIDSINIEDLLEDFVNSVKDTVVANAHKKKTKFSGFASIFEDQPKLVQFGKDLVKEVKKNESTIISGNSEFIADLEKIKISHFMGVNSEIEIPVDDLNNGVWLIEGENGSGKSTVLEAIAWCQFGEFIRSDMTKDFAINDLAKECEVSLEYKNGFKITRSRKRGKPDEISTYNKDENGDFVYVAENEKGELRNTQKKINEKLGISMPIFSKSIVLGQNILNNFMSGGKEQRRTIIEEALGLQEFDTYLAKTKSKRTDIERELVLLISEENQIKQQIEKINELLNPETKIQIENQISECTSKIQNLDKIYEQKTESLKNEESDLTKQLSVFQEEVLSLDINLKQASESFLSFCNEISKHLDFLQKADQSKGHCPTCEQTLENTKLQIIIRQNLTAIFDLFSDFCKQNNQTELQCFISEEKNEILKKMQIIKDDSFGLENDTKKFSMELIKSLLALRIEAKDNLQKIQTISNKQQQKQNTEMQILKVQAKLMEIDQQKQIEYFQIDKEISSLNTLLSLKETDHEEKKLELKQLEQKCEEIRTEKNEKSNIFEIFKFWELGFDKKSPAGFSNFRAFLLSNSITELNSIFSSYSEKLNPDQQSLALKPDLEFSENYGKRSGGERRRSDLITLFSMFELVRSRSKYHPQFMFLDEVFDTLDKPGRSAVQGVLDILASKINKVFVVTHTDINDGVSSVGVIKFKKDDKKNVEVEIIPK